MDVLTTPQQQQQQQRKSYRIVTQYGDMTVLWETSSTGHSSGHLSPSSGSPRNSEKHQEQQHCQQKTQTRPIIMTFHDLGLNSELQFASFCNHKEVRLMLQTFTMIHVNFIGQEMDAGPLETGFKYPSCEQLAECIVDVCAYLRIRSFIALAVGAGAHIVSLLALMRPDLVDGLFLINPVMTNCSITEWLYFKMSAISASGGTQNQHSPQLSASPASGGFRALLSHMHLSTQGPSNKHHSNSHSHQQATTSHSSQVACSPTGADNSTHRAGGSRLRRLILSRNFLSGGPQTNQQPEAGSAKTHPVVERSNSASSSESQRSMSRLVLATRRPPYEYLMYHHFGPGKFQSYKRSDDEFSLAATSDASDQSPTSRLSEPARTDSLTGNSRRSSSSSFSLSASYLSGIGNASVRQWHIQAACRHHFGQLNAHNLWLFAQVFVNRHSLNLRKDCGAAAHAAAAAANLGTSICSVFVGGTGGALTAGAASSSQQQFTSSSNKTTSNHLLHHNKKQPEQDMHTGKPLVAGTKVKRTFNCQTLVMCSSVGLHRERASKLMSLLNPIQTTCIQTDHLLILEEKPEKVCQALRLFLQGIGYSMSTYERRLRLGSAAAGSSVDSANSAASSGANPASDLSQQQQQQQPLVTNATDTC